MRIQPPYFLSVPVVMKLQASQRPEWVVNPQILSNSVTPNQPMVYGQVSDVAIHPVLP